MDKPASLNDLRLYIGYLGAPNEVLDDLGRTQMAAATERLYRLTGRGVLELVVDFSRSGLQPLNPQRAVEVQAREPAPARGGFILNRFNRKTA